MKQAEIEIAKYNPFWPSIFEKEKNFLQQKIGQWFYGSIEHIGSTAVPGLMAKPVIDIMFGVESLEKSRPAIEVMQQNDYCYFPYKEDLMHWFCKPSSDFRTHHLHLVPFESELWNERLLFRDILRSDNELAQEYQQLKLKLAKEYAIDRESYTDKKWPFIKRVISEGSF